MAEDKSCKCNVFEWAKAIALIITSLTAPLAAYFGASNSGQLGEVQNTQDTQVQRAIEVKRTLENRTKEADIKLVKIERAATAVEESIGPQLWSTWKYLEGVSELYPTPENIAKANEAKAAYESYLKKK